MGWFIFFRVTLRLDNIIYSVLVLFHKVSHCCLMLPDSPSRHPSVHFYVYNIYILCTMKFRFQDQPIGGLFCTGIGASLTDCVIFDKSRNFASMYHEI